MRRLPFAIFLTVLGLVCRLSLAAEEPCGQEFVVSGPEEQRIEVDVVVTDRDGNPVRGLGRDDFQVFEDGQPVSISRFSPRDDSVTATAEGAESCRKDTVAGSPLHRVFVIDHLHLQPTQKASVLRELAKFVRSDLRPGDPAMVVSHDGAMAIEQRFTGEPQQVARAIENLASPAKLRPHTPAAERHRLWRRIAEAEVPTSSSAATLEPNDLQAAVAEAKDILQAIDHYARRNATDPFRTLDTLQSFFDTLAGVPGRKAVVFVSDGLPRSSGEDLYRAWQDKFLGLVEGLDLSRLDDVSVEALGSLYDLPPPAIDDGSESAVRETESFNAAWASRALGRKANTFRITFYDLRTGGEPPPLHPATPRSRILRDLAAVTGGFSTERSHRFEDGLVLLSQDLGSYYGLQFAPRPTKNEEGLRRVDVRMRHMESYALRHRSSYGARSRQQLMNDRTLASLVHETTENPLGVTIDLSTVHLDEKGHQRIPILVKIPVDNLVLLPVEDHYEGRVSIHVGARGPAGQTSPIESVQVEFQVPSHHLEDTEGQTRIFGHQVMLKMSPGKHLLAIGVLDEVGNVEATTLVKSVEGRAVVAKEANP